jgi:hypothetical protein
MTDSLLAWFWNGGHVYLSLLMVVISTAFHIAVTRVRDPRAALEILLMYTIGIGGMRGIFGGFVVHFFYADAIAASIGGPSGNPFQTEVAFTNLAFGVIGVLAFFRRDVWLPWLIGTAIMGWGAGYTHLVDLAGTGNAAPNNAGPILWADFLMPIARIVLYAIVQRYPASPPAPAVPPRAP